MPEKPILQGRTITLRPVRVEDAEALLASMDDPEVDRLTGTQQIFTLEQIQAFYAKVGHADDRADYAIIPKEDPDLMVGEVVLNGIDWTNRSSSFRIALFSQQYFGKGYGTEAAELIIKYGFENLDLHRIELEVFDFNPRAAHVYEKVGFRREGVKRDTLLWKGVYHNAIVMSILKPEYEERKKSK